MALRLELQSEPSENNTKLTLISCGQFQDEC